MISKNPHAINQDKKTLRASLVSVWRVFRTLMAAAALALFVTSFFWPWNPVFIFIIFFIAALIEIEEEHRWRKRFESPIQSDHQSS